MYINLSSINKSWVFNVVVVPLTVRLPATVKPELNVVPPATVNAPPIDASPVVVRVVNSGVVDVFKA